jgi:hypothetical protein
MGQKRAKIGGEVGANGEFYEGGKFIATTDHSKRHGSVKRKPRKVQIRPFEWVIAEPGQRPIFPSSAPAPPISTDTIPQKVSLPTRRLSKCTAIVCITAKLSKISKTSAIGSTREKSGFNLEFAGNPIENR